MNQEISSKRLEEIRMMVERVRDRKESEFFREPFRYADFGMMDYPIIVTHAMDLSTILNEIESGSKQSYSDIIRSLRSIWHNAMVYNAPGSPVYKAAKIFRDHVESEWEMIFGEEYLKDTNRPPSDGELIEFGDKLHMTESFVLGKIIRYLDKHNSQCLFKRLKSNEIEINVDLIHGDIFRQILELFDKDLSLAVVNQRKKKQSDLDGSSSKRKKSISS